MQVCPNCSHRNRPGVIFCENCGASLLGDAPIGTRNIGAKESSPELAPADPIISLVESASSDVFSARHALRIEIGGAEAIILQPKSEMIFGRRDPATGAMPDIDLTPFAGYRMGVSRRHAAIRQMEQEQRLDLFDLGSSNGTFLNGTRLPAHKPHKVRDGDEIRLGQMVMRVYFQPAPQKVSAPEATQPSRPVQPAPVVPPAAPAAPASPAPAPGMPAMPAVPTVPPVSQPPAPASPAPVVQMPTVAAPTVPPESTVPSGPVASPVPQPQSPVSPAPAAPPASQPPNNTTPNNATPSPDQGKEPDQEPKP